MAIARVIFAVGAGAFISAVAVNEASPSSPPAPKPHVIMVCGFGETPGKSCLDALAVALRNRGYAVDELAWTAPVAVLSAARPNVGIGYSYGGDSVCQFSAAGFTFDHIILLDPVLQGNIFAQGAPMSAGKFSEIEIFDSGSWFPNPSKIIIDKAGGKHTAVTVPSATHYTVAAKALPAVLEILK
jgi:hypothetical protein